MKIEDLRIGQKLYNHGDMANSAKWVTIVGLSVGNYGDKVEVVAEDGTKSVYSPSMVSNIDKGHGGTRIVTEEAYKKLRAEQMAAFEAQYGNKAAAN